MWIRSLVVTALIAAVPAVFIATGPTTAQVRTDNTVRPTIRVTEEAMVPTPPDRARVHLAVVTQAPNAADAASRNAERVARVIAALRGRLGQEVRIETAGYTLNPDYRYKPEGGQPTLAGYTASNTVRVTIDDLKAVGRAIDVAINAGANQVQSLEFLLRDETGPQTEALRLAARRARAKAEALAAALDQRVVRVLAVEEAGAAPPRPFLAAMSLERDASAKTPIEPGSIEARASVTLTVEIAPR
jgi:uncharacterized protein